MFYIKLFLISLGLSLSISGTCLDRSTEIIDNSAYTQAQNMVAIEQGRRLNIYCTGTGSPTIILESGLGDSTKAWGLIQPVLDKETHVCSYDRAGLGFSDPANSPGTSLNAVNDLHKLLQNSNIPAPYILVGHSYGAMNVKLFAEMFTEQVAGLVLVDPSHEDMGKNIFALDPAFLKVNLQYLNDLEQCLQASKEELIETNELSSLCIGQVGPRYSESIRVADQKLAITKPRISAWISEMRNVWRTSADQVRNSFRTLGKIPIVILTKPHSKPATSKTKGLRDSKNKMLSQLHDQTVAMSSRGRIIRVNNSGHYIQLDQPNIVNAAILDVLHEVR